MKRQVAEIAFTQLLVVSYKKGHRACVFLGAADSNEVQPVIGTVEDVKAVVTHLRERNPNFEIVGPYEFIEDGTLKRNTKGDEGEGAATADIPSISARDRSISARELLKALAEELSTK